MLRLPAASLLLVWLAAACNQARPEAAIPAAATTDAGPTDGPASAPGTPGGGPGTGSFDARSAAPPPPWRWGPITKDGCTEAGLRSISAPLRAVPAGTSAAQACQNAPRNVLGLDFPRPDRCEEMGGE